MAQLPAPSVRKAIRSRANVTIRVAAQHLGVSAMTFLRYEDGQTRPPLERAIAYRQLLDALVEATQ